MAESVGQIGLDLVVNRDGFNKQMQGISGLAKKAGATLAAAFAVKKLVDFSKQCIELGSDLAEVQNVVDVTFTSMSNKVNEFAKNAATSFGLSETMAKRYTGTFGAMAKAFGFTESAAYDMGTTLTGLAGDIASFYNITQDEAYTKLKSVFTGETESLKDLGVVMTQSALDAYALANGFGKTTSQMTEAEKVALRYAFVQKQLATASGDFARTSDSWANQTRMLSLQFNSLKASIGQGLINAFLPVIKMMNTLLSKIQSVATAFSELTAKVFGKAQTAAATTSTVVSDIGEAAISATESTNEAADAAKKASASATGIDELNILSNDSGSNSGTATGAGIGIDANTAMKEVPGAVEEQIASPMENALLKIKALMDEITQSFIEGFLPRFKDLDFSGITNGIASIGTSLQDVLGDVDVKKSALSFVKKYASTIGSYVANFISIGNSIATNITSGVSEYLLSNTDFIKDKFVSMFDSGSRLLDMTTQVNEFLASIFDILHGDTAISITESLVEIFANSYLNIKDLTWQFAADFTDAIISPILEHEGEIKDAISNTLKPIETIVTSIKDFINESWKKVFETYDAYIKPAFENFKSGLSKVLDAVLDAYNTCIAPTLQKIADKFSMLMTDYIAPLRDAFLEFAGKAIEGLSKLWDECLAPLVSWMVSNFGPFISNVINTVSVVFMDLAAVISSIVTTIFTVLGDLIDFIVAVFTGDWSAAWEAIKSLVSDVWEGIRTIVSTVWEAIKAIIFAKLNEISSFVAGAFKTIQNVISSVLTAIKSLVQTIWNAIKDFIVETITNISNKIADILNGIKKLFLTIWNKINSFTIETFTAMHDGISNFMGKIFDGIPIS